jgi:hypothetical protein
MTERRKYESPIVMPLGGLSTGEGGCVGGSGDTTGCYEGNGYVAPGCYSGTAEGVNCQSGQIALATCADGGVDVV